MWLSFPVGVSGFTHHSEVKTRTYPHPGHGESNLRVSSFPADLKQKSELHDKNMTISDQQEKTCGPVWM